MKETSLFDLGKVCYGCGSCFNICPQRAITLHKDEEGFLIPSINHVKCNQCNGRVLCVNRCPAIRDVQLNNEYNPDCYAFCAEDDIREKSSSGGVFPVLADYFIEQGGYVCGAVWKGDYSVAHIISNHKADIDRMRQSKYTQSDLGDCLLKIKRFLKDGKQVLFVGTPCEIAGLYSFLKGGGLWENLYTIDLICHGVASPIVLQKYIKESLKVGEQVVSVNLRDKRLGWRSYMSSLYVRSERGISYRKKKFNFGWIYSGTNLPLNDECYNCKFRTFPRQADLTMGDFWSIQEYDADLDDDKGTSIVICNNGKGKFLRDILSKKAKKWKSVPIEYTYSNAVLYPFDLKPDRKIFFQLLKSKTVNESAAFCGEDSADYLILNFWSDRNYGGILTAYAMQELVRSFGYTTKNITVLPPDRRSRLFADRFLSVTRLYHYDELPNLAKKTKGVILGSDQVLRFRYITWKPHLLSTYYLSWVLNPETKKIALAPSFGVTKEKFLEENNFEKFYAYVKPQIKSFDYLSCREISGKRIYKELFELESDLIIDPVFLVEKEKYEEISLLSNCCCLDKVLTYLCHDGARYKPLKQFVERKTGSQCVSINIDTDIQVWDFLKLYKEAKMVITNTYHGACFALLFHKPLICIMDHPEYGGSRFDSLIELYGIPNNFLNRAEDVFQRDFNYEIDYSAFDKKVLEFRKGSLEKIREVLRGNYSNNPRSQEYRKISAEIYNAGFKGL